MLLGAHEDLHYADAIRRFPPINLYSISYIAISFICWLRLTAGDTLKGH
jgi:hypothetical protein